MNGDRGDELVGEVLGRYRLESLAGSGGMGRVYLATLVGSHGFKKKVAVKVLPPELASKPRLVSMFIDEVRLTSRIDHTNVCSVFDFGTHQGVPYLVMEYLDGIPLSQVIRPGRRPVAIPPRFAARIIADAARGLHAAHELKGEDGEPLNVIHRDVSPRNIFVLREGAVKVLDFGIARMRGRLTVTQANEIKGTLQYLAPERFKTKKLDRRVDVWSLGAILWESTVGRRLVESAEVAEVMVAVTEHAVPKPSSLIRSYPRGLEAIVMNALRRDPDERTPTAAHLVEELERFIFSTGQPTDSMQVAAFIGKDLDRSNGSPPRASDLAPRGPDGFGATESLAEQVAPEPDEPTTMDFLRDEPFSEAHAAPHGEDDRSAKRAGRILLILILCGAVVLVGVMIALWTFSSSSSEETPGIAPATWRQVDARRERPAVSPPAARDETPATTVTTTAQDPAEVVREGLQAGLGEPRAARDAALDGSDHDDQLRDPLRRNLRKRSGESRRPPSTPPTPTPPAPDETVSEQPGRLNLLAIPNADVY